MHQGTAQAGHYYSLVKDEQDVWCTFDDEDVTLMEASELVALSMVTTPFATVFKRLDLIEEKVVKLGGGRSPRSCRRRRRRGARSSAYHRLAQGRLRDVSPRLAKAPRRKVTKCGKVLTGGYRGGRGRGGAGGGGGRCATCPRYPRDERAHGGDVRRSRLLSSVHFVNLGQRRAGHPVSALC